jgi:dTDP-glucose 4,6-dehydratase
MTKQKILITGSCGFVMGNLVRKAIYEKQPYQIVSLDMVNVKSINSMYWNKNHIFHIADIRDQHTIDVIFQFEKPDIVIHGAEKSHGDSLSVISTNILGTQNIIDACIKHKVEKFLYLSTNEISANHETMIPNVYHTTKISGGLLTLSANISHKLPVAIARLSNTYGPRQSLHYLIPRTIKCILDKTPIVLGGDGVQVKEWTHVFDSCAGILNILDQDFGGEIYNITSGQEVSDLEVVQKICNIVGRGHDLITCDKNLSDYCMTNYTDGIAVPKLETRYKFKDGIVETVEWYMNNQWWFK